MKHENLLFLLEKAVACSGLVMPGANSLIVCHQDSSIVPVCVYLLARISIATSLTLMLVVCRVTSRLCEFKRTLHRSKIYCYFIIILIRITQSIYMYQVLYSGLAYWNTEAHSHQFVGMYGSLYKEVNSDNFKLKKIIFNFTL